MPTATVIDIEHARGRRLSRKGARENAHMEALQLMTDGMRLIAAGFAKQQKARRLLAPMAEDPNWPGLAS